MDKISLVRQLDTCKQIMTATEWLIFGLAFYECLSLVEIQVVLDKPRAYVEYEFDNAIRKAASVLGQNMKLLSQTFA